ncbi:MAG: hypothetical protein ACXADX_18410, partial [Candidatus Hodarchaeales archaeon]
TITRNGTVVESSSWDGGAISINVDGLSDGTYEFQCTAYDYGGNTVADTVLVQVTPTTTSEEPDTSAVDENAAFLGGLLIGAGAIVGLGVLLLLLKRILFRGGKG